MKEPEAVAMEHLALAVANLRAAASWLMDGERNREEIASAINQAVDVDNLMKAVAFNLVSRKNVPPMSELEVERAMLDHKLRTGGSS